MRIAAAAILLFALGCSEPANSGPQLRYTGIGINQETIPLVFALKLANDGDAPAVMDRMALRVNRVMPLYDEDAVGDVPEGFDADVTLLAGSGGTIRQILPGQTVSVAPGETSNVHGAIKWAVPATAAPMIAFVSARLIFRNGDALVYESQPFVFMLQSQPGSIALVEAAVGKNQHQLPGLLRRSRNGQSDFLVNIVSESATKSPTFFNRHASCLASGHHAFPCC
jgi:hypothetical protein